MGHSNESNQLFGAPLSRAQPSRASRLSLHRKIGGPRPSRSRCDREVSVARFGRRALRLPDGAPELLRDRFRHLIRDIQGRANEGVGAEGQPGHQVGGGLKDVRDARLALKLKDDLGRVGGVQVGV